MNQKTTINPAQQSRPQLARYTAFGWLSCVLLPLLSWSILQPQEWAMLTTASIAEGRLYTLWTGHLLHFMQEHFVWDALMFICFAVLLWREQGWRLWAWLLLAAPFISIAVFWLDPQLTEYRGLSALDTMLFVRFCLGIGLQSKGWDRVLFGWLPLIGLSAKIVFECVSGNAYFVSDLGPGVVPLPSAHLLGLLFGVIWTLSDHMTRLRQSVASAFKLI